MPMPRLTLLFLALYAAPCAAWQVVNRVVIEHGALRIDHSKSIAEITRAQAQGGFPAKHGLGLFQNRVKTELMFEQPETAPKIRRLSLTTRILTAPIIYIAREFPEGSCAYRVVLDHERLHQMFDLEVLRAIPDEIGAISRAVFSGEVLEAPRPQKLERARNQFFQQYKYVYDALSFPRHQRIDNPDSYRLLSGQCNGQITRLMADTPS